MKSNKNFRSVILLVLLTALLFSGCYWRKSVQTSQVGIELRDGVTVSSIRSSGRYTDMGYYADMVLIDVSNITTEWVDASLVTKDKQPIGLTLALTFSRNRNSDAIEKMFNEFRAESESNESLIVLVHSRVPSVAKAITTKYTLDQMLGIAEGEDAVGRAQVEADLEELLSAELDKIGVVLQKAAIADIGVEQAFLDSLSEKAQATIRQEIAQVETITLQEELLQEQAQTQINLELASRENQVNEVIAEAFENSPELFELEKLRLLAAILGDNDLVIYIPEGTDIVSVVGSGVFPIGE